MAVKKKTSNETVSMVAFSTIVKGDETYNRGDTIQLTRDDAARYLKLGHVYKPGQGVAAAPKLKEGPSADDVKETLSTEVYPSLRDDETSPDGVPNVDMLSGKVSAIFGVYVKVTAEVRDETWKAFKENLL